MASELCIIGHDKSESNLKLLEEAKKAFSTVFFVPISGIHIGLKDKFTITYRTSDLLKFKAVLPRIPRDLSSYAYKLLSLFPEDTYMSTKPISFLLAAERFFLLTVLRKRGLDTINLRLTQSKDSAYRIIEENSFPLVIRTPDKKTGVYVKNKGEAKSIVDTFVSLKQPVLIEDVIDDMVSVYVSGPEVIASTRKKTKEKDLVFGKGDIKSAKINTETKHLALETAKAIESQFAKVDIALGDKPRVVNVDLNPSIISPSKATGVNIPQKMIESLKENVKAHSEKPILMKFFEDAGSVVKDVLKTKQLIF